MAAEVPEQNDYSSNEKLNVILDRADDEQQIRTQKILRLRKAKSRDAARSRRGKENHEFYELAKLLPIPTETSSQLDKASIIRLTMSCLKMHEFAHDGNGTLKKPGNIPPPNRTVKDASATSSIDMSFSPQTVAKVFDNNLGSHVLQCLDGFMFVLNDHGKFLYVSETVSVHLGLSQVELVGSSIIEYTHPSDHDEILRQLGHPDIATMCRKMSKEESSEEEMETKEEKSEDTASDPATNNHEEDDDDIASDDRSFFIRMKSTLARRGVNVKSSGYKVVHVTGRIRRKETEVSQSLGFSGIAIALPPPSISEIELKEQMFISRMNSAFVITYCESNSNELLDFDSSDLIGRNLYQVVHAVDGAKLQCAHTKLLKYGQTVTPYYRILKKKQGCVWVQSYVTVAANQKLYPDPSYIWINLVISECVDDTGVTDATQLPHDEFDKRLKVSSDKYSKLMTISAKKTRQKRKPMKHKIIELKKTIEKLSSNEHFHKPVKTNVKIEAINLSTKVEEESKATCSSQKDPVKRTGSYEAENSLNGKKLRRDDSKSDSKSEDIRNTSNIAETKVTNELKSTISVTGEDTDFLDTDSQVWENPPNKEISNHNELPPGIKQMHGLLTIQPQPTVVDHHYPLGINPALLHANPLLAKMFSLTRYTTPSQYFVSNPLQIMALSTEHENRRLLSQNIYSTPTSVLAVLEELKKDPLHRINPPNKVVLPNKMPMERLPFEGMYPSVAPPSLFLPLISGNDSQDRPIVCPVPPTPQPRKNSSTDSTASNSSSTTSLVSSGLFGVTNPLLIPQHLVLPSSPHTLMTSQALPQSPPTPLLIGPYYHTVNQKISSL